MPFKTPSFQTGSSTNVGYGNIENRNANLDSPNADNIGMPMSSM
jgi:hypothetical protein